MTAFEQAIKQMQRYAAVSPSIKDPLLIARAALSGSYNWIGETDCRFSGHHMNAISAFQQNMVSV